MEYSQIWENRVITDQNSALVLIDYQPAIVSSVAPEQRQAVMNAAICAAKTAFIRGIPVVLSSIGPKRNGPFIPEIATLSPDMEVCLRTVPGFDAFNDATTLNAIRRTGRKKIVLSAIPTSECFLATAIHGMSEGFEIYGLMDAAGDMSVTAHTTAVKRMVKAGVFPVTLDSLIDQWMYDLLYPESVKPDFRVAGSPSSDIAAR